VHDHVILDTYPRKTQAAVHDNRLAPRIMLRRISSHTPGRSVPADMIVCTYTRYHGCCDTQ